MVILTFWGFYNLFNYGHYVDSIKAVKGELDLSDIKLDGKDIVPLQGQWKFYDRQLIFPRQLLNPNDTGKYSYMPIYWGRGGYVRSRVNGIEYGTFVLKVKTGDKNLFRDIRIPSIYSAYNLWIDGELMATSGVVADNLKEEKPKLSPITKTFTQKKNEFTIVLQVSNFSYGGNMLLENIEIGNLNSITEKNKLRIAGEMFLVGSLFMVAIYNFNLFFFNKKSKKNLYFAIINVLMLLRMLIMGEKLFVQYIPNINWQYLVKAEYIFLCLTVISVVKYFKSRYPLEIKNQFTKVVDLISYCYIIFIMISNIKVYSKLISAYQIFIIFIIVYMLKILIRLALRKDKTSSYIIFGAFIFSLTIVNDILYYNGILRTGEFLYLGLFVFITIQAVVISSDYSKTLDTLKDTINREFITSKNLEIEKYNRKLAENLREVTSVLNSTLDLKEVIKILLESIKSMVPYDSACVMLEKNDELYIIEICNPYSCTIIGEEKIVKKNNKLINSIITYKKHIVINDVEKLESEYKKIADYIGCYNSGSLMGIPLLAYDTFLGILILEHKEKNLYHSTEVNMALSFAAQASIAIQNAKLFGEIAQLAETDYLTGVNNRRSFFEISHKKFEKCKKENLKLSLIMLDIDYFKTINDTYGHIVGDEVLVKLADICKKSIRDTDIIGRYGGEEFGIIVPGLGNKDSFNIAEKIRLLAENTAINEGDHEFKVTVSMGIQELKDYHNSFKDLLSEADKALYKAKNMGKNRIEFYE